ncbi:MAG TPA: hypothetical protein VEA59_04485 [Patescibacteria group bacterium]|nr:hypothetical protein [Patescibacteria group bacterium]
MNIQENELLSLPEAAKYSGKTLEYLHFLCENKLIPCQKAESGFLVSIATLEQYKPSSATLEVPKPPTPLPITSAKSRLRLLPGLKPLALAAATVLVVFALFGPETSGPRVLGEQTTAAGTSFLDSLMPPLNSISAFCFAYWWVYPPLVLLILLDWIFLLRKRHNIKKQTPTV